MSRPRRYADGPPGRQAEHQDHQSRDPLHDEQDASRSHERGPSRAAGRPAGRPARPGSCGSRRWPAPARRWRRARPPRRRRPATAARCTGCRPRPGRRPPRRSGRETSARTSAVKAGSGSAAYWISSSPIVSPVPAADRVAQPVRDVAADRPGCRWRRPAVELSVMYAGMPVSSLLSRSPGPGQTNQPRPITGMTTATHRRARRAATWWCSARERRRIVTSPCAPSSAASTKQPWRTTSITAMPGRTEPPGSGSGTTDSAVAVSAATAATSQATRTGIRVERGIRASTASTHEQRAEPPRAADAAPNRPSSEVGERREPGRAGGRSPSSSSEPAPCHRAGSHHGASSTGTTPRATSRRPPDARGRAGRLRVTA